jgi:tetratricopeptide (TPR) repeat protein
MKLLMQAMVGTVFFALLTGSSLAQSPREQLQQLTIQLQQIPNDNALRERIIKLAAEMKPVPAVPEEARRSFVEGVNIVKLAKDAGGQKLAIGSFTEALKIAPWWGDAYYNLGVAQELAEQYDKAEQAFTFYLLSNPDATEQREVQDRIYQLSAKRKLVGAQ